MIGTTEFAGEYWKVLKKENGKVLLTRNPYDSKTRYAFDGNRDCASFFEYIRQYLNCDFANSVFSEHEKNQIIVVENKYPVMSTGTDDLGFRTTTFKMEVKKDRVFPLRHVDVCNLSNSELKKIGTLRKRARIILLPQSIDKNQRISTISCYEDWKNGREYQELDGFSYDTLREDITGGDYNDYDYNVFPAIWVKSSAIDFIF